MKSRIRPVRVGVVGTGALGYHHARLLKKIEGAELAGIYDINPARAAQVAKELETVAHPSLEALLDRVEATTVVVPTPAHVEVGLAVLERGLHALIEKPLADTLPGAEQLVHVARAVVHEHVDRLRIAETIAGLERVARVELRRVVRTHRGGNTTLCVTGVAFSRIGLREDDDVAGLGERDGGTQTGDAAADDQEIAAYVHRVLSYTGLTSQGLCQALP